jgi:hypothetical protein
MKLFPAFLVIIKTNYGKIIGMLVDSKFESIRGFKCEINGDECTHGKPINNLIIYYFLEDQLIKCPWEH